MSTTSSPNVPGCEYILLVATPSERKQLKEAAKRLDLSFTRRKVVEHGVDRGEYYELGRLGGQAGNRVNAISVEMGAHGFSGSASKAIYFLRLFGAQAIICLGMAFGVDRTKQEIGDVLVSVGLLPYDDRTVRCDNDETNRWNWLPWRKRRAYHRYEYDRIRMHPSKESLVRLFERQHDALKLGSESSENPTTAGHNVHFGLMLTGSLRVQCATYRDALVKDVGNAVRKRASREFSMELPPIVGGEMEGIGLLSTSDPSKPTWIVVKAISDFADGQDARTFPERRDLACANSAEFVLKALDRES